MSRLKNAVIGLASLIGLGSSLGGCGLVGEENFYRLIGFKNEHRLEVTLHDSQRNQVTIESLLNKYGIFSQEINSVVTLMPSINLEHKGEFNSLDGDLEDWESEVQENNFISNYANNQLGSDSHEVYIPLNFLHNDSSHYPDGDFRCDSSLKSKLAYSIETLEKVVENSLVNKNVTMLAYGHQGEILTEIPLVIMEGDNHLNIECDGAKYTLENVHHIRLHKDYLSSVTRNHWGVKLVGSDKDCSGEILLEEKLE